MEEALESIWSGGIPSPPRPSRQNSMKNVGVLDRRHAMWTRTGVPAVQCRLCCAAFATLFLPESICVAYVLAVGLAWPGQAFTAPGRR